ncbi:hypothetical protein ABZU32_21450 [Sphaerisporangium sp. NPDC005288]|uniref:hypothetical protein n=1 Tax=Sphaerisporangium sp. NPDC005288 TaxID=3155114 RepID=UPI0033BE9C54
MVEVPLQVASKALASTAVSMEEVAAHLEQVRVLIDRHCHLPSLALGVIGAPACARYNDGCSEAGTAMTGLAGEAATLARTLGKSAVGYVSAEVANLSAIERAAEARATGAVPVAGRTAEAMGVGVFPATWVTGHVARSLVDGRLGEARAAARSVSAELDTALEQALKVWGAQRDLDFSKAFMHPDDAVLAETRFNDFGESGMDKPLGRTLERQIVAEDRVSDLAKLSRRTDAILRKTGSFSLAAAAASMLWTANAVVMSDETIDAAIGSWHGTAAVARTIFSEWMPAIRSSLFPDWTGEASTAAERRFAAFVADGTAFADRAQRMASSLTTIVARLNGVYFAASAFAFAQLAAMVALAAAAWFRPEATALLQYLGLALRHGVTISVNAALAVLGTLLSWSAA